jgi:Secretion system C-terminal sorting domain/Cleaved Adhesin Domain
MRKLLTVLLVLSAVTFSVNRSSAQVTWSENFNSVTPPALPTGWSQKNLDGLTVVTNLSSLSFGTNAWVGATASAAHGKVACSTSWYTPAGTSNDWLVTPQITPVPGSWLLWDATALDASFLDGYMVRLSTTDTAIASFTTNLFTTAGENAFWTTHAIDMSAYAGMPVYIAFINNSNDKFLLYVDNVMLNTLPSNDMHMTSLNPTSSNSAAYGLVGQNVTLTGSVRNEGATTVTSYNVKYTDGTTVWTTPRTGVNIAPFGNDNFTISTPYNIASVGAHPLTAWVEVVGDASHANDSLHTTITGASFKPDHRVTLEEATGTWCGWCPRGAVYMDSIAASSYGDSVVLVAVHNSDPMVDTIYDSGLQSYLSGYPTVVTERKEAVDPSDIFTTYHNHRPDFAFADMSMTVSMSGSNLTANATAHFAVPGNGSDWQLALIITEDEMSGTTTAWDQHNYYSTTSNNIALTGAGHDWQHSPNPIPAAQMIYNHVARDIVSTFQGTAGSLPATIAAGSSYNYTFNYTLRPGAKQNKTHANIVLINTVTGQIVNGCTKQLNLGINEAPIEVNTNIFPNPSTGNFNLEVKMPEAHDVQVIVTDLNGKVINTTSRNMQSGVIALNLNDQASGEYIVTVLAGNNIITKKITKF